MKNLLKTLMYISVFTFSSCDLFSGKDNKMVNKIWKNQFPCNEEHGEMFSLYDTEKKVDGVKGFPIYNIWIDKPNNIKDVSIFGGFEIVDETRVKNPYGGKIYEQIFEGKKMTHIT